VGARGFYLWPGERDALAGATAATLTATDVGEKRAVVVTVHPGQRITSGSKATPR
jgi:hypothetical protein